MTFTWVDGPLSALNIKVLDADKIGLDACFYAGPIDNVDLNGTLPDSGIRLFVATGETTFNQLAWRSGLPSWTWEQSWEDLNGHASPACYDLAGGNVTYVMFVGQQNAIELYWFVCFALIHTSCTLLIVYPSSGETQVRKRLTHRPTRSTSGLNVGPSHPGRMGSNDYLLAIID